MAAKAALVGAKMVRSGVVSTAATRSAVVRAPASAVRLAARAVVEALAGTVRTVSMMWTTPPENWTSWVRGLAGGFGAELVSQEGIYVGAVALTAWVTVEFMSRPE